MTGSIKEIVYHLLSSNYGYYYLMSRLKKSLDDRTDTLLVGSSYGVHGISDKEYGRLNSLSGASQDLFCDLRLSELALGLKASMQGRFTNGIILLGYYALYDDLSMNKKTRELMRITYEPIFHEFHHYEGDKYDRWQFAWENGLKDEEKELCEEWILQFLENKDFFNEVYHREDNTEQCYRGLDWQKITAEERTAYGEERAKRHNKLKVHEETAEENRKLLFELIKCYVENGIKPFVVIPPFTEEYNRFIDETFREELLEELNQMPYVIDFYDFNQTGIFGTEDFFDMDHLNDKGREKFTEQIMGILQPR